MILTEEQINRWKLIRYDDDDDDIDGDDDDDDDDNDNDAVREDATRLLSHIQSNLKCNDSKVIFEYCKSLKYGVIII